MIDPPKRGRRPGDGWTKPSALPCLCPRDYTRNVSVVLWSFHISIPRFASCMQGLHQRNTRPTPQTSWRPFATTAAAVLGRADVSPRRRALASWLVDTLVVETSHGRQHKRTQGPSRSCVPVVRVRASETLRARTGQRGSPHLRDGGPDAVMVPEHSTWASGARAERYWVS